MSAKEEEKEAKNEQESSMQQKLKEVDAALRPTSDPTDPDALYAELIGKVRHYHPSDDISIIEKAYHMASEAHKNQKRRSGEPYIIHPLNVAIILADLQMDKETIVAGLLHDVVEDTDLTDEDLEEQFGEEVELLVDGVTKLSRLNYAADKVDLQAENLRKMFLAMAQDIRVILVKLADRLHNMRTAQYWDIDTQKKKARETLDIYAPIAHRLGISKIQVELDDLSLKYLEPEVYEDLEQKVALQKDERQDFVDGIVAEVTAQMQKAGIEAHVEGRVKHYFSIYKKMVNQQKTLDQIYDLFAVRIIVNSVKDCYAALGVIHEMYTPIPGRFKDYIAMPKENMYQSLHTTLIGPNGLPFEIQIRTYEMHRTAEYGIAAHWKYKEAADGNKGDTSGEEEKLSWLRQVLDWQRTDNKEFMSLVKSDFDLFSDSVYCFTPAGDVKNLPTGSTPIDFAYSIHTAVGNKMIGARVNGKLVSNDYKIQNGDRIEIITSQNSKGPSLDWLKIVKSSQAKNKINQWFRQERKEDNIIKGKEMLSSYCKSKGLVQSDLMKPAYMNRVMAKYGFHDWDSVMAALGHGGLKEGQIVNKLLEGYRADQRKEATDEEIINAVQNAKEAAPVRIAKSKSGIVVQGLQDVSVRFAKCCSPIPGDEIVGFITRGRGVTIHRTDCINVMNLSEEDRSRLIDAEWQQEGQTEPSGLYQAEIEIYCNNRTGLLADISKIFTERKIDVRSINSRTNKQGVATISMTFEVPNKETLQYLIDKIRQVNNVIDIERTTG